MVVRVGAAARRDLDAIVMELKAERLQREGLTQQRLAGELGVAMGSLKDWEGRRDDPTMINFARWVAYLGFRLVVDDDGVRDGSALPDLADGEGSEQLEIRRLASALRVARKRRGIRQVDAAVELEIVRGSFVRWETGKGPPPRPVGLAQWARVVGCVVRVRRA